MPEGDILRRVAGRLTEALAGRSVTYCLLRWPNLGDIDLTGRTVTEVSAYGKHLLTRFDDGNTLRTHLRMEGSYQIERAIGGRPGPNSRARRWTARAVLANSSWVAIGDKLGMVDLVRTRDESHLLGHLGPDVMGPDFDPNVGAARIAAQGTRGIGETLLDQRVVVGMGTIYMAESLFAWRVRPDRPANQVPDLPGLLLHARSILIRSVEAKSPTATGQTEHGRGSLVWNRQHRPCLRCGTAIAVMTVGQAPLDRPAYFCPTCQPA